MFILKSKYTHYACIRDVTYLLCTVTKLKYLHTYICRGICIYMYTCIQSCHTSDQYVHTYMKYVYTYVRCVTCIYVYTHMQSCYTKDKYAYTYMKHVYTYVRRVIRTPRHIYIRVYAYTVMSHKRQIRIYVYEICMYICTPRRDICSHL